MNTENNHIRFVGGAQGFNWLPVFVAEDQGFFSEQGLNIEYVRAGSVEKATEAVLDRSCDLAITPPEGAIANSLNGGPLRIIGSNSERLPMSLVANAEIESLQGLRGKRLGTSSLKEGTAIYTRMMLEQVGLHYPEDYEFVLAGIHLTRWQALQDGEIDAAPQPAPWNFLAAQEGFRLLGDVADVIPEIVFAAVIAHDDWLESHPDQARRLIAALARAHDFVNDPTNDSVSVEIYQRITTPDHPELARRGFEYTRELGMWPAGLRTSAEALDASIDVMRRASLIGEDQVVAARSVLDLRFTQ